MLLVPSPEALVAGLLELSRDHELGQDEGALAARYVRVLGGLLPGRTPVVRLLHGQRVVAHAPAGARLLAAATQLPLELRPSALRKTGLGETPVRAGLVSPSETPRPVVVGATVGLSIPLVARGALLGTLDVGYGAAAITALHSDERMLIPIANHLAVALGNLRLHAETAHLRDYLGNVIDNAGALILGADPVGRITIFNRALADLVGRSPAEVLGTELARWLPRRARAAVERVVADALAGRPSATFEAAHRTASGQSLRTVWSVTALGSERAREVIAVGQDLTRVESLQRQVIQAEKLATLGQLAAGVVHEINNPLTSITVYAEYLLRKLERAQGGGGLGPFEGGDVDKLRRIMEGAGRIQNLARDLVRYGRPDGESVEPLVVNDVVRQAVVFCEHLVERHRVRLELALAPNLDAIEGMRSQLQQVLINLLTNAAHALPETGGLVRVATRAAAGNVVIAVEDDGRGIPPADLQRIFEPFFTTKTDGQGTGLGLSIVQRIIERHRGRIEVRSTPGRGTHFEISLPVR